MTTTAKLLVKQFYVSDLTKSYAHIACKKKEYIISLYVDVTWAQLER